MQLKRRWCQKLQLQCAVADWAPTYQASVHSNHQSLREVWKQISVAPVDSSTTLKTESLVTGIWAKCAFSVALNVKVATIQWRGISVDCGGWQAATFLFFFFASIWRNDTDVHSLPVTTQPRIISYLYYSSMLMCLSRFACVCVYIYRYIYTNTPFFFTCFAHSMPIPCERKITVQTRTNNFITVSVNLIFLKRCQSDKKIFICCLCNNNKSILN